MGRKFIILGLLLLSFGCSSSSDKVLRIGAAQTPHAQILEAARPALEAQGIDLEIVFPDDETDFNYSLSENEIDANFFQSMVFLEEQVTAYKYPLQPLAKIYLEPMGLYSSHITAISQLPQKAKITIPTGRSHSSRALILLHEQKIITLSNPNDHYVSQKNIIANPKNVTIEETDDARLYESMDTSDLVAVPANFAFQSGLSPLDNALAIESPKSPYVHIIAVRVSDKNLNKLKILMKVMTSEKMREAILTQFGGLIVPVF